jgi:hypothetical protein
LSCMVRERESELVVWLERARERLSCMVRERERALELYG